MRSHQPDLTITHIVKSGKNNSDKRKKANNLVLRDLSKYETHTRFSSNIITIKKKHNST